MNNDESRSEKERQEEESTWRWALWAAVKRGDEMTLYKHMHRLAAARDDGSRPLAERVAAAEVLKDKQLENQNATQQSVQTIDVLMERFADTWRCYPEPKK